jgi:hypothetical protein
LDCPGDGHVSDPRSIWIEDRRAVHEPDRHVAAGVAPQNVGEAITIVVAGGNSPGPGDA